MRLRYLVTDQSCIRGIFRGCSGDGYYRQDTAVEACEPLQRNGDLSGYNTIEIVSANEARSINCWACQLARQRGSAPSGHSVNMGLMALSAAVVAVLLVA